jgi:hypothetical protein
VSKTDAESGFFMRNGKPQGFFYLEHRTVDAKYAIITDAYVTPGNVADSEPYLDRLAYQTERFGFSLEAVGLDAGYHTGYLCKKILEKELFAVMSYRRPSPTAKALPKRKFHFVPEKNLYVCPMGCMLTYRTVDREGQRQYRSRKQDCQDCPLQRDCLPPSSPTRVITRHIWQDQKDLVAWNRRTPEGKIIFRFRHTTVERSFADAKELHGYRYAKFRGKKHVQNQAYLTASVQNLKKIALQRSKRKAA